MVFGVSLLAGFLWGLLCRAAGCHVSDGPCQAAVVLLGGATAAISAVDIARSLLA